MGELEEDGMGFSFDVEEMGGRFCDRGGKRKIKEEQ